jgi:hypothetical protein
VRNGKHVGKWPCGRTAGFAIIEGAVAASILVIAVAACIAGFIRMNHGAMVARLRTTAVAVAQQKVDEVLTTPWPSTSRPVVLSPTGTPKGGRPGKAKKEKDLPMNQGTLTAPGLNTAFTSLHLEVKADRETIIEDVPPPPGRLVRQVRATVAVTYSYRGKEAEVLLQTLRTSDSF